MRKKKAEDPHPPSLTAVHFKLGFYLSVFHQHYTEAQRSLGGADFEHNTRNNTVLCYQCKHLPLWLNTVVVSHELKLCGFVLFLRGVVWGKGSCYVITSGIQSRQWARNRYTELECGDVFFLFLFFFNVASVLLFFSVLFRLTDPDLSCRYSLIWARGIFSKNMLWFYLTYFCCFCFILFLVKSEFLFSHCVYYVNDLQVGSFVYCELNCHY